ncbi:Uncharacterised protein [Acholeplasma hippikon]|uniref:Uncharacterized protein n=2 Tax=Acholeplasma hippikon TaxID=264636 RepID=A0A449BJY5_9MOLU|nr:Uncharacterised protein [Acholeplasma hippikon]
MIKDKYKILDTLNDLIQEITTLLKNNNITFIELDVDKKEVKRLDIKFEDYDESINSYYIWRKLFDW